MEKLYIGVKGHVVCLDKATGNIQWEQKLKTADLTNIIQDGNLIFAHAAGHLFCLDAATGHVKWKNELSGLGYGACIFATNQQGTTYASAYEEAQRRQARGEQNT